MLSTIAPQDDKRPLPLIVSQKWDFPLAYVDQDGDSQHYLYCARDWFIGLGGDKSRWSHTDKSTLRSTQPVEVKRANGKTESLDFVLAEDLYRLAANMRAMEKRPQLQAIKDYLAAAGVFADLARREPEVVAAKLLARVKGIEARNEMTTAAHETHEAGKPRYGTLTNAEYEVLFGAAKEELVQELGLTKTQAAHFRDQLGELALKALEFAEAAAATKMRAIGRKLTHEEQLEIVRTCAAMVAPSFHQLINYLNVNQLTNLPKEG